jgi:hypothetical protein
MARVTESDRHLIWEGCFNVRDLGGLSTADGGVTRRGALVRADALDKLTEAGWLALWEHGVRTVVDLRNDDELHGDASPRPPGLTTIHLPLDGIEDREFWDVWQNGPQFGTPLYYGPHLARFPQRSAAAVSAIARAPAGGVAYHCGGGRDRAGQITMLILALAGVPADAIAADYMLSFQRLPSLYDAHGEPDQGAELLSYLEDQGTSAEAIIVELLRDLDVAAHLGRAGLTEDDLAALRRRLVSGED